MPPLETHWLQEEPEGHCSGINGIARICFVSCLAFSGLFCFACLVSGLSCLALPLSCLGLLLGCLFGLLLGCLCGPLLGCLCGPLLVCCVVLVVLAVCVCVCAYLSVALWVVLLC